MKLTPLSKNETGSAPETAEWEAAHEIGSLRIGSSHLFFKKRLTVYYISYDLITRLYRRVEMVGMKMCCGKGNMAFESLVICEGETELAVVHLPGTKAAKLAMEELKEKAPHASFVCPKKLPEKK